MPVAVKPTKSKIKIVYILPTLDRGGAERFLADLILNLNRQIYEPTLILFKRGGDWLAELTAENVPVIILDKKRRLDLKNFWQLFWTLKKLKPQIVHTQLGGDLYGRLAARILKVPVIISTEQNVNPDAKPLISFFKKLTSHWADKIVAISQAVRDDVINRYQIPIEKVTVIYNGLEIKKFLNNEREIPVSQESIRVGTIGRLEPQKGQTVLIKAWGMINQPTWSCHLAGEGSLTAELTQQITRANLNQQVKLIGPITNVALFLKELDIFVLPSLWEGLGIVLLEAGLSGCPIIASQVDGVTEIINEKTGWLVPAGDAEILAQKIVWLGNNLSDPAVQDKTIHLKEKIIQKFSITRISEQYSELYQSLLKQKEK